MTTQQTAVSFALAHVGDPYEWGGTGPTGWDCSGLVQGAYRDAGVWLPRVTYAQLHMGFAIEPTRKAMEAGAWHEGDLVFPYSGHVQLYVGAGRIVEAPAPGGHVQEVPEWWFEEGHTAVLTVRRLGAAFRRTLAPGDTGPAVTAWQRHLGMATTGRYDARTEEATASLQQWLAGEGAPNMAVDGICGPITWDTTFGNRR